MNWFKLAFYDLKYGILRKRNVNALVFFLFPLLSCYLSMRDLSVAPSWIDYMAFLFKGMRPFSVSEVFDKFSIPFSWMLVISGLLILSIDYPLNDLSNAGQQIIFRCGKRISWYFSKCIWNLVTSILYYSCASLLAVLFTMISFGELNLEVTTVLSTFLFDSFEPVSLSSGEAIIVVVLLPLLTLAAYNILQMTLCLFIKPVYSFTICVSLLLLAAYVPSGFVLGNGAMIIRSSIVAKDGVNILISLVINMSVVMICIIFGLIRFKHFDILAQDE